MFYEDKENKQKNRFYSRKSFNAATNFREKRFYDVRDDKDRITEDTMEDLLQVFSPVNELSNKLDDKNFRKKDW